GLLQEFLQFLENFLGVAGLVHDFFERMTLTGRKPPLVLHILNAEFAIDHLDRIGIFFIGTKNLGQLLLGPNDPSIRRPQKLDEFSDTLGDRISCHVGSTSYQKGCATLRWQASLARARRKERRFTDISQRRTIQGLARSCRNGGGS